MRSVTVTYTDPFGAVVHSRIEGLQREVAADAVARRVRRRAPAREVWPRPVVAALRDAFGRRAAGALTRTAPCPTC
jgi:hypothetical protein